MLFAAVACAAATSTAPSQLDQLPGNSLFNGLLSDGNGGLTYQLLIDESELTAHQGSVISGISFRLERLNPGGRPLANVSFGNYDIRLSKGVDPSERSSVFSENILSQQKLVRSGGLAIAHGSYTTGDPLNTFGPVIAFQTGYSYDGGDLLIEIRQNGFSGGLGAFVDATSSVGQGYGTAVAATWGSGYSATSGGFATAAVTRIVSAVPEPMSAVLFTAGLVVVLMSGHRDRSARLRRRDEA